MFPHFSSFFLAAVLACPIERNDFYSWTQPTTDDGNWLQRRSGGGYWWLFGDASTDKGNDATATSNNEVDDPRHRGSKGPRRALSGKQGEALFISSTIFFYLLLYFEKAGKISSYL